MSQKSKCHTIRWDRPYKVQPDRPSMVSRKKYRQLGPSVTIQEDGQLGMSIIGRTCGQLDKRKSLAKKMCYILHSPSQFESNTQFLRPILHTPLSTNTSSYPCMLTQRNMVLKMAQTPKRPIIWHIYETMIKFINNSTSKKIVLKLYKYQWE